jgi:hypothetical protein
MVHEENDNKNDFINRYEAAIKEANDILSYDNDPFFKKKLEEANKAFDNAPLPEHIAKLIIKD